MASPQIYPSLGGTTGGALATKAPLYTSGYVWYVDYTNGTDAASPAGRQREKPLKTLAQAVTNASNYDIICFLSGHAETLTAVQAISKTGLVLTSEGTGANRARFTRNVADELFDITGTGGVVLQNLYFPASSTAATNGKVRIGTFDVVIDGCYFEAGANDTGAQIEYRTAWGGCYIRDTTIISTSSSVSSQPESAIKITNAGAVLDLLRVTISGGTSGWSQPYAFNGATAVTNLRAIDVDLLLNSDVTLATGTTGFFHTRYTSGNSHITWAA